jgi:hypothetical protein
MIIYLQSFLTAEAPRRKDNSYDNQFFAPLRLGGLRKQYPL